MTFMEPNFVPALILLACAPLAAQNASDGQFVRSLSGGAELTARARLASAAAPAPATAPACDGFPGVEKLSYTLTLKGVPGRGDVAIAFAYASCDWYPRNDYILPYTEIVYHAADHAHTLVTETTDGETKSEVVLQFNFAGKNALVGPSVGVIDAANLVKPGTYDVGAMTFIDAGDAHVETPVKATLTIAAKP
jgi:hypothetical protein